MLKIKEAVIVEGRYDKLKLSNVLDTLIIETNGFGIFKDKEKMKFIRRLADDRGIIILTDSDHSGFQIRNYLASSIDKSKIKHIYIPDVYGKERRKKEPSKEGKIGVEGINSELLLSLFEKADVDVKTVEKDNPITNFDLPEYQDTLCERETTENSSPTHKVIQLKKDQFFLNFVKRTQRNSLISQIRLILWIFSLRCR